MIWVDRGTLFYHILDIQKVIEGGPWSFKQNLPVFHKLDENEDPHPVQLNEIDIWVQLYDLPMGMQSEKGGSEYWEFCGDVSKDRPIEYK